ncbi:MAG: tetratricopeptide repeat protein [Candidatus Porifericomitaceae bacterium WSBS_2022_MAG_OTU9]
MAARVCLVMLFALSLFACTGSKQQFDPLLAVQKGEYNKALDHWYKQQESSLEAQNYIGVMHYMGLGVPQDHKHASEWFERAARAGYAPAQFNLGIVYRNGYGIKQDMYKAFLWMYAANTQQHQRADTYMKGMAGLVGANIVNRARQEAEPFIPE